MSKINAEMKVYFDTHIVSSRMPPLRLKHLKLDGWGELHGPLVKAANTRHFMPFLQQLANRYLNSGSPYYTAINKLIEHANGVYHALYSSDMFLNDEQVAFLSNQVLKFGKYHMICRMHASNLGHHLFQVKPKAHYAQHIPFQSILINSRHTQCYCAESLIGKMTTIWKKSVSGPYSNRTVQRQVCVKYLVWVFILHGMWMHFLFFGQHATPSVRWFDQELIAALSEKMSFKKCTGSWLSRRAAGGTVVGPASICTEFVLYVYSYTCI